MKAQSMLAAICLGFAMAFAIMGCSYTPNPDRIGPEQEQTSSGSYTPSSYDEEEAGVYNTIRIAFWRLADWICDLVGSIVIGVLVAILIFAAIFLFAIWVLWKVGSWLI